MRMYAGAFLVAMATLSLQVALTRLLSITAWYFLAFFAIALAMLGLTAGAATVYLNRERFSGDRLTGSLGRACLYMAGAIPLTLVVLCLLPIPVFFGAISACAILAASAIAFLPFYFSGIVITGVLTCAPQPSGRLYAADLLGAATGCLFILAALEHMDVCSAGLLCAALAALAAMTFAYRHVHSGGLARPAAAVFAVLLVAGLANSQSPRMIRPYVAKSQLQAAHRFGREYWNSFSRVTMEKAVEPLHYWGRSAQAPEARIPCYRMTIDGAAGTHMRRFASWEDLDHLRYDVTNVAYYLRPTGGACVIGVGGGRDVQSALRFGHQRVLGIELNPAFIRILKHDYADFAGLAGRPEVELVVDEARSYLSRSTERFPLIQMSLVDTWAATGAGAFSLSENNLYTVEAWQIVLDRLTPDGVFTVSRWYSPERLGETGRLVALACEALRRRGVQTPLAHLAVLTRKPVATLVLCARPFEPEELTLLKNLATEHEYKLPLLAGREEPETVLTRIARARTAAELDRLGRAEGMRFDPTTDENPYFFNMLRLDSLHRSFSAYDGVVSGNMQASCLQVGLVGSLLLIAAVTIIVPLMKRARLVTTGGPPVLWSGALYFVLIGCGFMLAEIAMIQKLSVLISHPVYALGILLFALILSSGLGAALSERLPLTRAPGVYLYPLATAAAVLLASRAMTLATTHLATTSMTVRIAAAIAVIFPLGLLLGLFFPTGMSLVRRISNFDTPWYWALNGVFGVLCSAVAVLISIYSGISTNLYISAACYTLVLVCVIDLHRRRAASPRPVAATAAAPSVVPSFVESLRRLPDRAPGSPERDADACVGAGTGGRSSKVARREGEAPAEPDW